MDDIILRLKGSLYDGAYKDILRTLKSGATIGAFILTSCLIDYLAGLRYSNKEDVGKKDYKKFVEAYLQEYNADDLYASLRCLLVHNYSEGGKFLLVDKSPDLHLMPYNQPEQPIHTGKKYINIENYIADVRCAMDIYFSDLENDHQLQICAKNRVDCLSILEGYKPNITGSTANETSS